MAKMSYHFCVSLFFKQLHYGNFVIPIILVFDARKKSLFFNVVA